MTTPSHVTASLVMDRDSIKSLTLSLLSSPDLPMILREVILENEDVRVALSESGREEWVKVSRMAEILDVSTTTLHDLLSRRTDPELGLREGVHYLNPMSRVLRLHSRHLSPGSPAANEIVGSSKAGGNQWPACPALT